MEIEKALAERIVWALGAGETNVDQTPFIGLTLDSAKEVQRLVQELRGETALVIKTAFVLGRSVAAPIFKSMTFEGAAATVSSKQVSGIEVEVAAVLARDLDPGEVILEGESAVLAAIDHFVVGIELIGSRYKDRSAAGPMAQLADNLSTAGYVADLGRPWRGGAELAGAEVVVTFEERTLFAAPANHGFGSVLASLVAYAQNPVPCLPLKAGLIVTTGSVCGLVDLPGPGRLRVELGEHSFELTVT